MADTDQFDDTNILARTIWGEARGEGDIGMEAVASVVLNRINSGITWWGNDIRSVCLKPYQFSCWNDGDPNRPQLMALTVKDEAFVNALHISTMAVNGVLVDSTDGATSYYDSRMETPPSWSEGRQPVIKIGHHLFFVDPKPSDSSDPLVA